MSKEPPKKCCNRAQKPEDACWECGSMLCKAHRSKSSRHAGYGLLCSPQVKNYQDCAIKHEQPVVWRANIRPNGNQYEFALSKKVFGVGWGIANGKTGMKWKRYLDLAEPSYKDNKRAWERETEFIHHWIAVNDLVWICDRTNAPGIFYLGRILDEWTYRDEEDFRHAGLTNVRNCEWVPVPREEVPGDLYICVRTFVEKNKVREYSKALYNRLTDSKRYDPFKTVDNGNIWMYLSHSDCEDIVGIYLQHKHGYVIVPSTCKSSTQGYEFNMINPADKSTATLQVKNGIEDLYMPSYIDEKMHIYLFTSGGKCGGKRPRNVTPIEVAEIVDFMKKERRILPATAQFWVDLFFPA